VQTLDALASEAVAPLHHRPAVIVQLLRDGAVRPLVRGQQHDPGTQVESLRRGLVAHPLLQLPSLLVVQFNPRGIRSAHGSLLASNTCHAMGIVIIAA
jgi:hypothetical protein